MKILGRLAVVLLAFCAAGAEQKDFPKFTSHTELVTVPVVVTRGGKFVGGLQKIDFAIQEDGKPKPMAFFEEIVSQPVRLKSAELSPGQFTNELTERSQPVPLTVIVLDRVYTPVPEFNNAVKEIATFVRDHVKPGEPVMLVEINERGLKVLQSFTTSPEELLAALTAAPRGLTLHRPAASGGTGDEANVAKQGYEGASIKEAIDVTDDGSNPDPDATKEKPSDQLLHDAAKRHESNRVETTIRAVEQIARSLSGIPGRKALLWTSPGYLCPIKGFMKDARGKTVASADQCDVIWRLLNTANISVYPIIPTQTENPTFTSGRCFGPCGGRHPVLQELIMLSYAEYTGGKVCSYRNDLATCYQRAVEDSARYYMLSYYATATQTPTWHRIHVTVNAPDSRVRARNWYMSAGAAETIEAQYGGDVSTAIVSPVDYSGIPLTVRWTTPKQENGKTKVGFEIHVRRSVLTVDAAELNHMRLHVVAVAMTSSGSWTADMTQKVEAHLNEKDLRQLSAVGVVYTNSIEVQPVTTHVKFVVRDDLNGNMGTVTARVPRMR